MSINHVSDGMTISRLVKRLLNGFAAAGMLLLFSSERAFLQPCVYLEPKPGRNGGGDHRGAHMTSGPLNRGAIAGHLCPMIDAF
jgi:hypothetical protein